MVVNHTSKLIWKLFIDSVVSLKISYEVFLVVTMGKQWPTYLFIAIFVCSSAYVCIQCWFFFFYFQQTGSYLHIPCTYTSSKHSFLKIRTVRIFLYWFIHLRKAQNLNLKLLKNHPLHFYGKTIYTSFFKDV